MEQRWNKRKSGSLEVSITHRGSTVDNCKSADLSIEGIFVHTGAISYPKGTPLKLDMTMQDRIEPLSIEGVVVHSKENGVGLMFKHANVRQIRVLKEFMDSMQAMNRPSKMAI